MRALTDHTRKKGSSSIMVMLIMLVLVVFGVLALMSSYSDFKLSKKSADWHASYYELDAKGEELVAKVDGSLKQASREAQGLTAYKAQVKNRLLQLSKEYQLKLADNNNSIRVDAMIQDDKGNKLGVAMDIPMNRSLNVNQQYRILKWSQLPKEFKYEGQNDLWNGEVTSP